MTWKIDLFMIALCFLAYWIDQVVLASVHILPAVPTLSGTAIAFFIAFNNNQAYGRWWEARTIWGGIVNDSRSWSRELLAHAADTGMAKKMILRHIGFLYALKAELRRTKDPNLPRFLSPEDLDFISHEKHLPNAILSLQSKDLEKLSEEKRIDGFRFLAFNGLIRNFCDGMGKSERINNTVFPTSYIYFTRLFIWILVIVTTMSLAETIGLWSVLFGWLVGFVFHAAHINGLSLMNPFELEPACVPLNSITRTIEINLLQDIGSTEIPAPISAERHGEYVL
jgi:putative membrane protein